MRLHHSPAAHAARGIQATRPDSESVDVPRANASENAVVRIHSGLPGNASGSESRCSGQPVRPNARTPNSYVKSAEEMFGVEEEEAFNDAVEKGYFEGSELEKRMRSITRLWLAEKELARTATTLMTESSERMVSL